MEHEGFNVWCVGDEHVVLALHAGTDKVHLLAAIRVGLVNKHFLL